LPFFLPFDPAVLALPAGRLLDLAGFAFREDFGPEGLAPKAFAQFDEYFSVDPTRTRDISRYSPKNQLIAKTFQPDDQVINFL
jgi:hypothetical protein